MNKGMTQEMTERAAGVRTPCRFVASLLRYFDILPRSSLCSRPLGRPSARGLSGFSFLAF